MAESTYRVSALKYRPTTFTEVLAQDHITQTLQHSLEKGLVANAYIFAGPRGTGKTTTARILAKALNCTGLQDWNPCNQCDSCHAISRGIHPDVLEIDAASNRNVEEIEQLRENTHFSPSMGKYKIYIIDECHMLTKHANNALLKTLEEPPDHTRFIFATTEADKLLPTIISRCQLFQFRRIPTGVIADHLKNILKQQGKMDIAEAAELDRILFLIARSSEGGLRDALVSLDQLLAFCAGKMKLSEVEEILGFVEFELVNRFIMAIVHHQLDEILAVIESISQRGREVDWFLKECLQFLRNLAVTSIAPKNPELVDLPEDHIAILRKSAEETSVEQILYITDMLWEAERRIHFSSESRMILEISAIKAAKAGQAAKITDLLEKLASVGGATAMVNQPAPAYAPEPEPQKTDDRLFAEANSIPTHEKATAPLLPAEPVPQADAPAPPKPAPKPVNLLSSSWNQLVMELENENQFLASALHGSVVDEINGETIVIAVPNDNPFNLNLLKKPINKKSLQAKLKDHFGKMFTIEFDPRSDLVAAPAAEEKKPLQPQSTLSRGELMRKLEDNETFNKILDVLPGKVVDIKPLNT